MTDATRGPGLTGPARPDEVSSSTLLGSKGELTIIHNGERYTLRITANKKLILTK
ncbi:MAG: hemin uptake protein HemP [Gammaproteobacteria bacterium]|nr:hemin uptake protein HemP [Gammaproteobacteria bacterium]MDP2141734.1 hemin uptake protein HemP [Gammaproteobacteria bacterium]MDP2347967.1 hemin uptake protein HemP [Gammaproteobacteria bacterium]